jgi:hypothetical protein
MAKDSERHVIQSLVNYINNIRYDEQLTSNYNDVLSVLLGQLIEKTENGFMPSYSALTYVITKPLETTKKDPNAEDAYYDKLLYWGQRIFELLKLPTRDISCLNTFLKKYQEVYMGSKRRHYVRENKDKTEQTNEMLKMASFLRKTYLEKNPPQKKQGLFDRIRNKKNKDT